LHKEKQQSKSTLYDLDLLRKNKHNSLKNKSETLNSTSIPGKTPQLAQKAAQPRQLKQRAENEDANWGGKPGVKPGMGANHDKLDDDFERY